MLLYLGKSVSVEREDIIGIFDIDNVNTQRTTKEFLRAAEEAGDLLLAGEDLPKSFLVAKEKGKRGKRDGKTQVVLCQLSARSLLGRACRKDPYEKESR